MLLRPISLLFMTYISSNAPAARKHDGEIITARNQAAWLSFEAAIHQNDTLIARVARALDRFGLGSSTAAVDEALDYLTNKELGQSARYFNQTGKAQFNQQQITHAVLSFMAGKEQQRHMTDLTIVTDDTEEDEFHNGPCGTHRACHMADPGHIRPDEVAARRDALRAIAAMIPASERELYSLMLAVREPGMLDRIHAYADRHQIGRSTVYFRIKKLAEAIQLHPWFDEITAPFRTASRTA